MIMTIAKIPNHTPQSKGLANAPHPPYSVAESSPTYADTIQLEKYGAPSRMSV